MSDDDPTITIKLAQYDRLRATGRAAEARILELEAAVKAAQLADPAGVIQQTHAALHSAIKIVQFAVGNLTPESIAGWPYEALMQVADGIDKIPGMDPHIKEVSGFFREFAASAQGFEEYRRERDKHKVILPATAADFGPQTSEAAAVHAARGPQYKPPEPTLPVVVDPTSGT